MTHDLDQLRGLLTEALGNEPVAPPDWERLRHGVRRSRRRRQSLAVAACAGLVAAVGLGASVLVSGDGLDTAPTPATGTPTASPAASPAASAPAAPTAGQVTRRLPLPEGHELQVVYASGQAPHLRDVDAQGAGTAVSPPGLTSDDVILDVALKDGRLWAAAGNCSMGRTVTWISDDVGRTWTPHDGPGAAHCSAGSATEYVLETASRATAYVTVGGLGETTAWTTSDGGATWAKASTALQPASHDMPAAGACGTGNGILATVETNPDVPMPRCVIVRPTERLRVVNTSNRFGEPGRPVVVEFAGFSPRQLEPGESTVFGTPLGACLGPGVHDARLSLYNGSGGAEIWLKPNG